jgi:hypothetical protein
VISFLDKSLQQENVPLLSQFQHVFESLFSSMHIELNAPVVNLTTLQALALSKLFGRIGS